MANEKISSITWAPTNTVYDIDLPTDATPAIKTLSVTENINADNVIAQNLYSEKSQTAAKRLLNIDDLVTKGKKLVEWATETQTGTTTLTYQSIVVERTSSEPSFVPTYIYRPAISFTLTNFLGQTVGDWQLIWGYRNSQTKQIEVELPLFIGTVASSYKAKGLFTITCSFANGTTFNPTASGSFFNVASATVYINVKCTFDYLYIYPTDHTFLNAPTGYAAVKLMDSGTINATPGSTVAGDAFTSYYKSTYDNFTLTELRLDVSEITDHDEVVNKTNTTALTGGSAYPDSPVTSAGYNYTLEALQTHSPNYMYFISILPASLYNI